ncbi:MAG: regulatory protein RecX [Candidatus Kapabacteria bacterium]|nr:regulatory protein RecX [Ignavibacteriota bacterium]MCW5883359.1 regulatory protein RecX [Candidatus Kapabacteria bacterium]
MDNEIINIEKIVKSRFPGNCVLILSNGNNIMTTIDEVMNLSLNKGSKINDVTLLQLRTAVDKKKVLSYSMRLSDGFVRSEFQIRQKLKQKNYDLELIEYTIKKLHQNNLIDDNKFAENFINYALKKKWGKLKIINELRKRGVNICNFQEYLNSKLNYDDIYESAKELALKKLNMIRKKTTEKQKDAIIRHLAGKGYEFAIIKNILKEIF